MNAIDAHPMTQAPDTDEQLVERLRAGDEDAFVRLYRRRQPGLFRFALQMSGSPSIAEDVTQEVFLTLIAGAAGRFDPTRGPVSAYLFGIARHHLLRLLGKRRGDVPLVTDHNEVGTTPGLIATAPGNPLDDAVRRETIDVVRQTILALPVRYREVIVLCDLQEVDYAGAAIALRCPPGTVRSRLHRARRLLAQKLRAAGLGSAPSGALRPARCMP